MRLKDYPNFVIDELPQQADSDKLYFLSRPIYNTVKYNDNNKIAICTTKEIRKFLMRGTNRIPSKFIVAFNDAKLTPSSREVLVHTIRTGSVCGNVMYLFEYTDNPNEKTLYTGQYTEDASIYQDSRLIEAIRNKSITNAYIDNTLAGANNENLVSLAADSINDLRRKYPKHKICLWADRLGSENLLQILSTTHNLKVYLNQTRRHLCCTLGIDHQFCEDRNEADILVFETPTSYKLETFLTAFSEKNIINLRLITTERDTKPIGEVQNGIVYIPYGPHPSAKMLMLLLHRVKPAKVIKIAERPYYGHCSHIPDSLMSSFIVEDAEEDAQEDAILDNAAHFPYQNRDQNTGGEEQERSFLNTSSDTDSVNSNEDQAIQWNESENTREPELCNESESDIDAKSQHILVTTGKCVPIEMTGSNHTNNNCESEQSVDSDVIELVQEKPEADFFSEHRTEAMKRKSSNNDVPEPKIKRRSRKHIKYLSSSSISDDIPSRHCSTESIIEKASIGTLSISSSSDMNPYE